jgi:hypothetical protein
MTEAMPLTRRLRQVVPLTLVVVVAAACGDNDKGSATPKTPTGTTTLLTGTRPPSAIGGGKAKLVTGKGNLLPLLQGDLSRFVPTQVEGTSLKVVALAGTDSFWAGRSNKERILVTMRLKGNKPPKVTIGQKVDFIGLLTALPADAGALGVRNGGDTTLLEKQGAYVNASVADVKLR